MSSLCIVKNVKARKPYYRDDAFLAEIGKLVRIHRLNRGLTQTELAFKCNDVDYSQINRLELGKINFTVSYLKLIATALEVPVKDLLP